MLIINEKDIEKAVEPIDLISVIEKAYLIQDKESTNIPDRMQINSGGNTLLVMPGFIESAFGTKLVSLFPENTKLNKPVLNGVMILNDVNTGEPIALINGSKLTSMRTGAVGATAAKYLSPNPVETLGIIGAGVQAYHQALIINSIRSFQKVIICDKDLHKTEALKKKLEDKIKNISISATSNANQLVIDSDMIITATSSNTPVFEIDKNTIAKKTFIGIGSYKPDMQEIPSTLFKVLDKVYVDTLFAKEESGDIKIPLETGLLKESNVIPFAALLSNDVPINNSSVNFFKSVGMSLFDLTVAELIYKKAKDKNLGTEVDI